MDDASKPMSRWSLTWAVASGVLLGNIAFMAFIYFLFTYVLTIDTYRLMNG